MREIRLLVRIEKKRKRKGREKGFFSSTVLGKIRRGREGDNNTGFENRREPPPLVEFSLRDDRNLPDPFSPVKKKKKRRPHFESRAQGILNK